MPFLTKIGLWLISLVTSETVKKLIMSILQDMLDEGQKYLPIAIEAVKTAAARTDLDSGGKFDLACQLIKESFPDIPAALLNSIVENVYGMLKKDQEV
jgi:hypothetical protein